MLQTVIDALERADAAAAVAAARQWVESAPEEAEAHHALGLALRAAGDDAEAAGAIDRAIALAPERPMFHLSRARVRLHLGEIEEAERELERSVELNPNLFDGYLAQAHLALVQGDIDRAEERIGLARRIAPNHPRALIVVGNIRVARGDADGALKAYHAAAEADPRDALAQTTLGTAYMMRGIHGFAEQAFRNAVQLRPEQFPPRRALAETLARQGRFAEAADALRAALGRTVEQPALWRQLGDFESQAGRIDAALEAYEQALALAPDDYRTLGALSRALLQAGRADEVRERLDRRLAGKPDDATAWTLRLEFAADDDDALAVARRRYNANPDDAVAAETLALLHESRGERAQALALADVAIARAPTRLPAQLVHVRAELQPDPEAAYRRLEGLIAVERPTAERSALYGYLADAAVRSGRPAQAVEHWLQRHALFAGPAALPPLPQPEPALHERLASMPSREADPQAPVLLYGGPGSGVERVAARLAGLQQRVLLDDRFSPYGRRDRFVAPELDRYAEGDADAIAAFGTAWQEAVAAIGVADRALVDWLPHLDARLAPALAGALPGTPLLVAVRDPRAQLLEWLAAGSLQPWPIRDLDAAAAWLASLYGHLALLRDCPALPVHFIDIDALDRGEAGAEDALWEALGIEPAQRPEPAPAGASAGSEWPRFADALTGPFAALTPVLREFGYPERPES